MMRRKIIGISLLELMLSLVIIAIMLVAAMRYYQTTRSSQEVNEALSMLHASFTAADNWYFTYKNFEETAEGKISLEQLQNMGLLPKDFTNPWGGVVEISPLNPNQIKISFDQVPNEDCANLQAIMEKQGVTANCDEGLFTLSYGPQQ